MSVIHGHIMLILHLSHGHIPEKLGMHYERGVNTFEQNERDI